MLSTNARSRILTKDETCGFNLTTTFDDNLGSYGAMFDVETNDGELNLFGFDFYTDVLTEVDYELYVKLNSFRDDDGRKDLNAWTLLKKASTNGAGFKIGTPVRDFGNWTMAANQRYAFYITLKTTDLRYRDILWELPDAEVGDSYVENEDLDIKVGAGVAGYPLGDAAAALFGKRAFSGTLHYDAHRPCPSEPPSAFPSPVPSLMPTPTSEPPSLSPTDSPIVEPSFTPSIRESNPPSIPGATASPTVVSSEVPSHSESAEPSNTTPSMSPSNVPPIGESLSPSLGPSLTPSGTMSSDPTPSDSFEPTTTESSSPTQLDSVAPSLIPSEMPSPIPTQPPSMVPSALPTTFPSKLPSHLPTDFPSFTPSAATDIPTLSRSSEPSRARTDDWECTQNDVVETAFEGGTGAYGNMFTVKAKETPLRITTLSFHTDYVDGNVTALVYSKAGDFVGFENSPRMWTKRAKSVLRGTGNGFPSTIPTEDFESVQIFPNETMSFYITLTTADIRYTRTNITLGKPIASSEFLDVNAGVGLADYPFASEFFIYSPRTFNGIVHFSHESDCLPFLNVTYSFNVHHPANVESTELNRLVSSRVEATGRSLALSRPELLKHAEDDQVSVDSAFTEAAEGSCKPFNSIFLCTPIDTTLVVKHAESVRAGKLKFAWLKYYEEMTLAVNLIFSAQYVGDIPLLSGMTLTLFAKENATDMTPDNRDSMELALIEFLSEQMAKKNVSVLDVSVNKVEIKRGSDVQGGRYLQRGDDDVVRPAATIDVTTSVSGEYRPPPEIDFPATVEDAIDAEPQQLEQSLKRTDTYFEIIQGLEANAAISDDASPEMAPPTVSPAPSSNTWIIVVSCAAAAVLLILGFIYYRRKRRTKSEFDADPFVKESAVLLPGGKSRFGGFFKKNKTEGGVMTAEVAWAEPIADNYADQSSPHKPQSLYDMKREHISYGGGFDESQSSGVEYNTSHSHRTSASKSYASYRDDPYQSNPSLPMSGERFEDESGREDASGHESHASSLHKPKFDNTHVTPHDEVYDDNGYHDDEENEADGGSVAKFKMGGDKSQQYANSYRGGVPEAYGEDDEGYQNVQQGDPLVGGYPAGPYQAASYRQDQYQGDSYQGDRYQGDQYQGDPYQGDQYQGDPYQGDQYQGEPYQGGAYGDSPFNDSVIHEDASQSYLWNLNMGNASRGSSSEAGASSTVGVGAGWAAG